jgi:hypothetical protein
MMMEYDLNRKLHELHEQFSCAGVHVNAAAVRLMVYMRQTMSKPLWNSLSIARWRRYGNTKGMGLRSGIGEES